MHHRSSAGLLFFFFLTYEIEWFTAFFFFTYIHTHTHPRDTSVGIDEIEKKLYITCRWHWPLNISSCKCVLGSTLWLWNKLNARSTSLLELWKQWFFKIKMHAPGTPTSIGQSHRGENEKYNTYKGWWSSSDICAGRTHRQCPFH